MAQDTADFESRLSSIGRDRRNFATFAGQSFPRDGLVAKSRIVYQKTALAIEEICQGVFVFRGAGWNGDGRVGVTWKCRHRHGLWPAGRRNQTSHRLRAPQGVRWLIDTHWHFDHTDGNQIFAEVGATIAAHANCRTRLSRDQYVPSLERRIPASPRMAWPTITLDGSRDFDIGSETLQLLPQPPSHTDGDQVIYLPSADLLITGEFDSTWGRGYVTGECFTRMVLAGLGIDEKPAD